MRIALSALFIAAVFTTVTVVNARYSETLDPFLYDYMTENFEEDTAAHNAIAAILLNYRMYDTMFEALILLTAIIGMNQFLPSPVELKELSARKQVAVGDKVGKE